MGSFAFTSASGKASQYQERSISSTQAPGKAFLLNHSLVSFSTQGLDTSCLYKYCYLLSHLHKAYVHSNGNDTCTEEKIFQQNVKTLSCPCKGKEVKIRYLAQDFS